ncbi:MAG TPA: enolase C-terminal domain-like protein [Chloroflexota bacterium]|nr:enolase C-terminal domain-like protein [Chloroflexota bacterium]
MKSTAVEAQYLKIPRAFRYAGGSTIARGLSAGEWTGTVVVQIRTDEGITGLGDIAIKGNRESIGRGTRDYVLEVLSRVLIGQDPFNLELLIDRLWAANLHENTVMVAGVDIALHDLVSKALGIPLYKYLGGKYREKVPLTWNVPADRDISVMVRQAVDAVENGFRNVIKVKTGTPWDVEALSAIQQAIGPNVPLRPDDNGAFPVGQSIQRYRAALDRGCRFELLEQPVSNDDIPGLRRLADTLGVRTMYHIGYLQRTVALEILRSGACDVVSIPVFRHGVREAVQLIKLFEVANIGCAMGSGLESSIAATAAIHVATALRNLNHPIDTLGPLYLAEDILLESPHFAAGFAVAPEAPGLGIELDPKKVEKYRIA